MTRAPLNGSRAQQACTPPGLECPPPEPLNSAGVSCASATLAVWCSAWLHGAAASDDVLDSLHNWATEHEFRAGDTRTGTILGLSEESPGSTPAEFLALLRGFGASTAWLVLPVPGDVRGLGDHTGMRKAALRAGEAAVFPGIATGALGVVYEHIAEGLARWTVFDFPAPVAPEPTGLGEAEQLLDDTLRESAATLQQLGIGGHRPSAHDEFARRVRARPHTDWPRGMPQRALRVMQRAEEISEILALALGVDEPGGTHSASAASNRTAALRPLTAAVRDARRAATDEAVRSLSRRHRASS